MSKLLLVILFHAAFSDDLISVVVIYRHGDRTPTNPYPNDPYKNTSFWPVGFGQLTNLGKQQHYHLGKWLRHRYDGFLPSEYNENDVYVLSTDVDRTLMSAAANLAGLYSPIGDQKWNENIPWQPIPIHTIPAPEDNLLGMRKQCPKKNKLIQEVLKNEYFENLNDKNRDLYTELFEFSGTNINSIQGVSYLYSTLHIETLNKLPLPDWTEKYYPEKLKWACVRFSISCYTKDLARLETGPLFNEIIKNFENATKGNTFRKLLVFSGHDGTIANVLNSMGAFEYHCPPFASTIMLELRHNSGSFYVNIFYKNSTEVQNITLNGCDFQCEFENFVSILKPITITRAVRDLECQLVHYLSVSWDNMQLVITFVIVLGLVVFVLAVTLIWMCRRRNKVKMAVEDKKPKVGCI